MTTGFRLSVAALAAWWIASLASAEPINTAATAAPVALVCEGATAWKVFVPADAGPVERFARDELVRYVEMISGSRFGEATLSDDPHTIRIGLRSAVGDDSRLAAPKKGYDGYAITVSPETITIAGDNARGVLYGGYDLLERLSCRWYYPTLDQKDPEIVPKRSMLTLAVGSWAEASPIEFRIYNGSALFFEIIPGRLIPQIDWAAKNRYNVLSWQAHHESGRVAIEMQQMADGGALAEMDRRGLILHGPGHCFPFFLPTERYFEQHPKWFGLSDGKRRKHGGEWPLMNFCWSNPEAVAEFCRNAEAFVHQWPQLKMLYMVGIDGGIVCGCEKCQARGGPDLIVDLFNTLSDRLAVSSPGVILETVIGYGPLQELPREAKPNGKWRGLYAHWGRHHRQSYSDADYAKLANMESWLSHFERYTICSYYAAASHQPFNGPPFLHAIAGDTAYLVEHNVSGHVVLQYPHGYWWAFSPNLAMAGLHNYYYPQRKPEELLRDYTLTCFGPQAGPSLFECLAELGSNEHLDSSYRASRGDALPDNIRFLQDMLARIRRAEELAGGDGVVLYRFSKLRHGLEVLLHLAPARSKLKEIEQLMTSHREGEADAAGVRGAVAAMRTYLAELQAHADRVAAEVPGVMDAEWLGSWTIRRTMLDPLDRIEKELNAPTSAPAGESGSR